MPLGKWMEVGESGSREIRLLGEVWVGNDGGLNDQGGCRGNGKKWADSGYILWLLPTGLLVDRL